MKKILLLTDNEQQLKEFKALVQGKGLHCDSGFDFHYAFSFSNKAFTEKFRDEDWIRPLKVNNEVDVLSREYDMIFSIHCKQMFPAALVKKVKCINVHSGLNPYNRGWFPQVFSILNGMPCGASIHEIDEELDHGPVICQKEVRIESWDTSLTAYEKILEAEMELLTEHIENILNETYEVIAKEEGNLNLKKDFDDLCHLDLDEEDTFQSHINQLRALTHGDYANAFFTDENGDKVYLKLILKKE